MSVRVVLVDSGGANLGSVRAALERLGVSAPLTREAELIRAASHVILPGVGAAGPAMQRLQGAGLAPVLRALRQPLLGICVGMQLLYQHSEEGAVDCLGLLEGRVRRFDPARCGRVPHMGWNRLHQRRPSPLLDGIDDGGYAYFVHSYAAAAPGAVADCDYGGAFAAVVSNGNVHGVQFHPERSAATGARLLANFLALR